MIDFYSFGLHEIYKKRCMGIIMSKRKYNHHPQTIQRQ
jgi:hypothetical protein